MAAVWRSYHDNVIDHFEKPRNVGSLDKKKPNIGTGIVGAPACGDVMKLQMEFADDGTVTNAVFKVSLMCHAPGIAQRQPARCCRGPSLRRVPAYHHIESPQRRSGLAAVVRRPIPHGRR